MRFDRYLLYFLSLGLFWGLSPSLNKVMAEAHIPVTHIITYSGFAVGIGLAIIAKLRHGALDISRATLLYGLGCATLMNVPFGLNLYFARFVPPTELALIMSIAPFFNYIVALVLGNELANMRRLVAVALGFLSSAVLILSRGEAVGGAHSWIFYAAFIVPVLYAGYNMFASRYWPANADTLSVGTAESLFSGLTLLPFMLLLDPPWSAATPGLFSYWSVAVISAMWVVERIAFFTLVKEKGSLYTVQAVYVSTPAAVFFAMLFFGGVSDVWLWISLALLMVALWLNNSGSAVSRQAATPQNS